jgi:metacaspase-1
MQGLLTGHYGFSTGNIKMLTDSQATTKGILDGLVWLLSNNTMGSELVFHYSGHGSQIPDLNGDEPDGLDEIICPYDLDWNNPISDDVLARLFKQLPAGIYLTMISDSCHSGTVDRDLRMNHRQKFVNMPNDMQGKLKGKKLSIKNHFGKKDTGVQGHILVSGCRDNQTSEDAYINGIHQGAFTWALTSSIKANLNSTWTEAYKATLTAMATAGVTSQTPQLSGNADLEARHVFGGVV